MFSSLWCTALVTSWTFEFKFVLKDPSKRFIQTFVDPCRSIVGSRSGKHTIDKSFCYNHALNHDIFQSCIFESSCKSCHEVKDNMECTHHLKNILKFVWFVAFNLVGFCTTSLTTYTKNRLYIKLIFYFQWHLIFTSKTKEKN